MNPPLPLSNRLHRGEEPERDEVDDEVDHEHQREGDHDRTVDREPDPGGTPDALSPM